MIEVFSLDLVGYVTFNSLSNLRLYALIYEVDISYNILRSIALTKVTVFQEKEQRKSYC